MPSKEDLEKWAKWMDSWQDLSGDKSKLRPGVLAAFLRSPELAEALATYEALAALKREAEHVCEDRFCATDHKALSRIGQAIAIIEIRARAKA